MAETQYPLSKTKFRVEIDGLPELGGWIRVSGLSKRVNNSKHYATHTNTPTHLPGKVVCGPIRLERTFDQDDSLAKWAFDGAKRPLNGSVIFLDYTGEEARRFNWSNGWVSEYDPGEFDALPDSEGPAIEVIEITVEDIFPG